MSRLAILMVNLVIGQDGRRFERRLAQARESRGEVDLPVGSRPETEPLVVIGPGGEYVRRFYGRAVTEPGTLIEEIG